MDKYFYQSKTVWGAILSGLAIIIVGIAEYFGVEVNKYLELIALFCGAFGVPFTIYGRAKAIGGLKK